MCHNVWVRSHDLLFRCEFGTLLELEISDSSGEGKIAVDTTEVNKTASGSNSSFLACVNTKTLAIVRDVEI